MRFGVCVASLEEASIVARAGFDFCELPARLVQPFAGDATATPALRGLASMPIPVEAFNVLVPGELRLCGPHADHGALHTYAKQAFRRMAQLGARIAVLGSGAARQIPEDFGRGVALDQLADAIELLASEAARNNIELALEHLNRGESNVFNTVAECHRFLVERGLGQARLLVDLYHLEMEHEPLRHVLATGSLIAHVHVADGGRNAPGMGGYNYAGFAAAIRQVGYDRRISAECRWNDLAAQAESALHFMQTAQRPTLEI